MKKCKCGKELLDREKKCERCSKERKERLKKIVEFGTPLALGVGVGIKKYGPKVMKIITKK